MITLIVRTILTYCMIVLVFRLMGKREIGELSLLDVVIFIIIAEIGVIMIEDSNKTIMEATIPILILVAIQRVTAIMSLKSKRFRDWFEGKPSLIIADGKIDENEMRKQRYNFDDLTQQLHEKDIKAVQDVEYAILEPSGKLSVFAKEKPVSTGMVYLLIMDGEIQEDILTILKKDQAWLEEELRKRGYRDYRQISYCTYDQAHNWYIDVKDKR
ncbi:DUF421 domain-containing protein [Amphibacillus sediminis]|uniref:DUF421 domain-containing protein n=1 Tax=Amphibacillus sediminis TaxID=360185 RepID=UPI00082D00B8|nr:DUF421 domain-containing protein [Amphibacillus sediminis]